ncbi:OmpA family protein [Henriciella aquimarina]|uniref:OmpA family protein n=1 Tax=Henriciella aquimarina TaxID=545261 RepID=UPI000A06C7EA|nr:OmpA family protein [Henriciella aquimarina]
MKKTMIGVAAAAMMFTTACQSGLSERQAYGAGGGALAGAALGTLAGGDDGRNAAIGAALGALAGGAVGTYMDRQEAELRRRTQGTDIQVQRQGDQIALTMPSSVTFSVDSAQLKPEFYPALNDVASTLVEYPRTTVDVVGHASSDGPDDYNMRLSERRANSVANYLQGQGVQPMRIRATGMGETQPVASNETEAGRAANRRVEILLSPVTQS